jgi:hypothetical protein
MAEQLLVHIFVRMQNAESVYLCGAKSEDVAASVDLEWADDFTIHLMCPECQRLFNAKRCSDTPES